jgi:hypothetical protein
MGAVRNESRKKKPSTKLPKGLASSSNISIVISYVIHPKYMLSGPLFNFHQIFVQPVTFICATWQDGCGKECLTKILQEG